VACGGSAAGSIIGEVSMIAAADSGGKFPIAVAGMKGQTFDYF